VITITTDFGTADGYQGVLEGIIAGINPSARVIVLSHEIPPGDILSAWYILKSHSWYFPPDTVHLAVVDPGVGSRRKIIAVEAGRHCFVAPDNGLLSFLTGRQVRSIHSITNRKYALHTISPVFHGRDIMAPAAAYLSLGIDPACLGRACKDMVRLKYPAPVRTRRGMRGGVIMADRFGNLITTIEVSERIRKADILVNGHDLGGLVATFSDVRPGRPLAYIGSGGHLEIAVRDASARDYFGVENLSEIEVFVAFDRNAR